MSEGLLQRVRRINASPPPEESIALRVAVLIAVLAAAGAVLHQDVGSPGLRLACIAGIPAGFLLSYLARNRDRYWLKVVLAFGMRLVVRGGGTPTPLAFRSRSREPFRSPVTGGRSSPSLGAGNPSRRGDPQDRGGRTSFGYFGFSDSLDTSLRGRPDDT